LQLAAKIHSCDEGAISPIRQALGSTVIDPALLTSAERIQYDGFVRRQDSHRAIKALAAEGVSIKAITRQTARSRKLVRSVLRGGDGDVFRGRESTLGPHLAKLGADWDAGCHNGTELWRRLRVEGYRGGLRVVTEWATRRRRDETAGRMLSRTVPPARQISRMMTTDREQLSKADAVTVAAIEAGVPPLAVARILLERFQHLLRSRDVAALAPWLLEASAFRQRPTAQLLGAGQ
jgi:transposase